MHMLDKKKIKILKTAGYILLLMVVTFIGIGIGQSVGNPSATKEGATQEIDGNPILTEEVVNEFLLNYYTKTDLGENRARYKDYMTDSLYKSTVAEEDKPINQTYKGFVVDFEFEKAKIYINQSELVVIAQVQYVNTLLDEKKNYETAQKNVPNEVTLRLNYVYEKGSFKVSHMESIILTDQNGDYGTLDQKKESSSESSSSSSSEEKKDEKQP